MFKLRTVIELKHRIGGVLFMHNKRPRYDLMEYKRRAFLTALSPQSHPTNPDFNPSATEMKKRSGLFAGKHAELSRPIMAPLVCCAGRPLIHGTSARGTLTRLAPRIDSESTLMNRSPALRHPHPGSLAVASYRNCCTLGWSIGSIDQLRHCLVMGCS